MAAYPQRTDLNMAPSAVPGQTYGEAGKQIAAQQQVPMAPQPQPAVAPPQPVERPRPGQFGPLDRPTDRPNEPVPMGAPAAPAQAAPQSIQPGAQGPLDRPTDRPNEPLTAGAPFGAGRMGEQTAYAGPVGGDSVLDELRALYAKFPNNDLADMIDSYIREGY